MKALSKKLFALLGCSALLASSFSFAEGAMPAAKMPYPGLQAPKEFTLQVENEILKGADPLIINGRSYVPFRVLFDALGAEVAYDSQGKTIEAKMDGKDIALAVGSKTAYVNQEPLALQVAPIVQNERTYIPIRDVANITGLEAEYASIQKKINVYDKDKLISDIDKDFGIYNQILQNSSANQLDKTYKSTFDLTGNIEYYDASQIKKAGGTVRFDGLTRGMDLNGTFDVSINLGDFDSLISGQGLSADDIKLAKDILFSKHQVILDSKKSAVYIQSDALSTILGESKGTWLKLSDASLGSMKPAMSMMNMSSMTSLLNNPKEATMGRILYESTKAQAEALAAQGMADYMPSVYDQVSLSARMIQLFMGDDGFVQTGTSYTMALNKDSFISRASKFIPEASADLQAAFKDVDSLEYKIVFADIDKSAPKMQMAVKVSGTYENEQMLMDMDIHSVGNDAAIKFTAGASKQGKIMLDMKSGSKETNQTLYLQPPSGATIKNLG